MCCTRTGQYYPVRVHVHKVGNTDNLVCILISYWKVNKCMKNNSIGYVGLNGGWCEF